MELASVATTEELATVALTEAMVATLGATGPTEAIMARERLSPRLLLKLRLTLTTAPMAMVDTDCLTDAPTVDTAFLTVAGMVATDSPTADSTAAATTARGKLRLRLTPPSVEAQEQEEAFLQAQLRPQLQLRAHLHQELHPILPSLLQDLQFQQLQPFLRQLLLLKEGNIKPMASF